MKPGDIIFIGNETSDDSHRDMARIPPQGYDFKRSKIERETAQAWRWGNLFLLFPRSKKYSPISSGFNFWTL
jgi:hypothetical protein